jgi:hypothetical protein
MRILPALLSVLVVASSAAAQTVIPVGPFRSIELSHGGKVTVRHGTSPRVTIVSGDARYTRVRVSGQRLVIENCNPNCPRKYRMRMEVITPELAAVAVSEGGTVEVAGGFPPQAAIDAGVRQGGRIDIRSIDAEAVEATVHSGGLIFTHPRRTLNATVRSGGGITYWGDPRVSESVRDGGVVARGTAREAPSFSQSDTVNCK